ncbi:MAG: hypothetical protein LBQ14_01520 [Treponema sp.]|jgi:hypothetical protein|nr:hypothetical protein [Treponema sp.]
MAGDLINLEVLSTRSGFNSAVQQIQKTIGIADDIGSSKNLGDLLFEMGEGGVTGERVGLLLRMLLVDKLGYKTVSSNLKSVVSDPTVLAKEFEKWKGVDLIVAYHHPDMGLLIANPKMAEELANFGMLRRRELLVVYAGKFGTPADDICVQAAQAAISLFEGEKLKAPAAVYRGSFTVKKLKKPAEEKPAKSPRAARAAKPRAGVRKAAGRGRPAVAAPAAPVESQRVAAPVVTPTAPPVATGKVRMTPMYSVVVQNELFHNGNVEAWKRIVASYNAKYPELQVYIYYEGERILDINSLFKWGKVKHGSAIQFAVAGSDIKDVAKLQRYLIQGASHQFEAFLHGPVNSVLKLF